MSNDFNLSFIKQETACHVLSSLEIVCFFHYELLIKEYCLLPLPIYTIKIQTNTYIVKLLYSKQNG